MEKHSRHKGWLLQMLMLSPWLTDLEQEPPATDEPEPPDLDIPPEEGPETDERF